MTLDPSFVLPSDDSGSATFERYCYQAHIAFPYCLNCALGGDVVSVIPEHLEDIAVQFHDRWSFLQIKTRNLERGPWKLADFTKKGGALHSMLRTHRSLGMRSCTLEVHVEGVVDRRDLAQKLLNEDGRSDEALRSKIQKQLKIGEAECAAFLARLRLVHSHPVRDNIRAQNLRLLVNQAGHLPASTLDDIYDRIVSIVYAAMQATLLPSNWKISFLDRGKLRGEGNERFLKKQITRQHLQPIVTSLTATPNRLLKRLIEGNQQPPTLLEQKLLMGGASAGLIELAKMLRAHASQREYEVLSSEMYNGEVLEDVQMRLLIRAQGLLNEHGLCKTPAATIWNELLRVLTDQHKIIDSHGVFRNDPDLLLGAICDLSDKCRTNWGNADA